jgi:type IV secretory pathway VirB4 component
MGLCYSAEALSCRAIIDNRAAYYSWPASHRQLHQDIHRRGTGNPGLLFFNRGAEPLVFDPLHAADRKKNAHMLILGPTGAGKSALLVYMLQQMLAIHRLSLDYS